MVRMTVQSFRSFAFTLHYFTCQSPTSSNSDSTWGCLTKKPGPATLVVTTRAENVIHVRFERRVFQRSGSPTPHWQIDLVYELIEVCKEKGIPITVEKAVDIVMLILANGDEYEASV